MRDCFTCNKPFKPSSNHKSCPACRKQINRKPCPKCGTGRIQNDSKTCYPCSKATGSANANWKGGKTYHKKGYVMVLAPGHPRNTRSSSYVFQHILVMEKKLGRYLLPNENVHHKNGVKDDNRPRNLELWIKPQPPGIRAKDAVAWAREIIALYADAA